MNDDNDKSEQLTAHLETRVTPTFRKRVDELAKKEGRNLAGMVRTLLQVAAPAREAATPTSQVKGFPERMAQIARWLKRLTERERAAIYGRYGIGGEKLTLQDLAKVMKITRERVRQVQAVAMYKLELVGVTEDDLLTLSMITQMSPATCVKDGA